MSHLKTGMRYLIASVMIALAAAVYGLFSHGVYSYFMTYAFMIPLLGGALPHLIKVLRDTEKKTADTALLPAPAGTDSETRGTARAAQGDEPCGKADPYTIVLSDEEAEAIKSGSNKKGLSLKKLLNEGDLRLAAIVTLTAGSLLKGALDIYGTTNRLLIAYPVIAALIIIAAIVSKLSGRRDSGEIAFDPED